MYSGFKYYSIPLEHIALDDRNPRIVTQTKLTTQAEILKWLFEHEELEKFISKIVAEGKNVGAERPYVVKTASGYTVIEGNSRIAAYKVLTGLLPAPREYASAVPAVSDDLKSALATVDCSVAPSRDALLPIVANAHFGLGDKSKWGYLGSRQAVYNEWDAGKSIPKLAKVFDRTQGQIRELIIEYLLYLKALSLKWTPKEKGALLDPGVQFNPPVRFLQTGGHKAKVGIDYDMTNMKVTFSGAEAKKKFKHLISKLVINPNKGLGATATYEEVFADYGGAAAKGNSSSSSSRTSSAKTSGGSGGKGGSKRSTPKPGTLFSYDVTISSALMRQLMKEAKDILIKRLPAASTFLLRNIAETLLKHIIDQQKANPASKVLDLEGSINLCMSNAVSLNQSDKKILKEFLRSYVSYLNLGAHGNVIPNPDMVSAARDCIDQFVKRNV